MVRGRNKIILVDYNQILISAVSAGHSSFGSELNPDMIRHLFFNMLLSYKKKFSPKYGDITICGDAPNLWRKKVFPYYKAKRAEGRAESPMDWTMIFETLHSLRSELEEFFPYKVVTVDGAEGDDVIAVLVHYLQENELIREGLEEVPQDILVISADKDFAQLQEYKNVSQYTPMFKSMIKEPNPRLSRFMKIIKGDSGDGVPNIFSDDDTFVSGKRQKAATEKRYLPVLEACINGTDIPREHAVNFDRNKLMIDLVDHALPVDIKEEIISVFQNAKTSKGNLMNYFMKFRMRNLASEISKF